jgi:hypothetical protein
MNFIQINNKNQYQRKQLVQFFEKIQTMKSFVKVFINDSFQSFTIFPFVKTRKEFGEYRPCIIEVAVLEELYFYSYRFFSQCTLLHTNWILNYTLNFNSFKVIALKKEKHSIFNYEILLLCLLNKVK